MFPQDYYSAPFAFLENLPPTCWNSIILPFAPPLPLESYYAHCLYLFNAWADEVLLLLLGLPQFPNQVFFLPLNHYELLLIFLIVIWHTLPYTAAKSGIHCVEELCCTHLCLYTASSFTCSMPSKTILRCMWGCLTKNRTVTRDEVV